MTHFSMENQVEVTFALDANGILAVTAQDTVTGAKAGAEIKAKDGRLSADEIDKMVQDAEKHRAQDDELADKVRVCRRPSLRPQDAACFSGCYFLWDSRCTRVLVMMFGDVSPDHLVVLWPTRVSNTL